MRSFDFRKSSYPPASRPLRTTQEKVRDIRNMTLRLIATILFISIAIFAVSVASQADASLNSDQKAVLKNISDQMNENKALSGDFIQTGPNGETAKGVFFLKRPGQMRFKYADPSTIDIIADGKSVAVINTQLETQDLLPIKNTPLRYLLRDKLNLTKVDGIKNVGLIGNNIVIIIEDAEAFNESQLRLFFNKDTYALEQWIVTDAQGLDTSVQLFNTRPAVEETPGLFEIKYPVQ